nr:hypothetical protein [Tanacetum cinerariifolium]
MAAGLRDRPPMLATGRYPQWRSQFLRYIDARPNGEALRKCILSARMVKQKEVNELRAERLARNANPLALVATAQADQDPYYQTSRHKGKEIAKPFTPPSKTASEEDNDPEQAQRDKDMQKNLVLIVNYFKKIYKPTNNNLRTSSNSRNKDMDTTLRYKNNDHSRQFGNQRTVNVAGARKNTTCLVETNDSNVIPDSPDMCEDDIQNDQNDVESEDKRVPLASLIANLKLDVKECDCLAQKLSKQTESVSKEVHNELLKCFAKVEKHSISFEIALQKRVNHNATVSRPQHKSNQLKDKVLPNNSQVKLNETLGQLAQKDIEIKEGLKTKAYELSVVKEKHDQLIKQSLLTKSQYEGLVKHKTKVITDLKLREEQDIEKMLSMEKQFKVFKRNQFRAPTAQDIEILILTCLMPLATKTQNDSFRFVHELKQEMHADLKYVESFEKEIDELESDKAEFLNMYDVILQECVYKDVMCSYLQSLYDLDVLSELQCLYLHKVKECDCLAQKLSKQTESVSKEVHNELLKCFAKVEKHSISFEIALQKHKELTKLVPKANVSKGLSKPVTAQTLPQTAKQAVSNKNMLKPGMYRIDNRPQHKSNQLKDKVMPNNSQVKVKKTQVEVHPRIPSVSNKMKSVTAFSSQLRLHQLAFKEGYRDWSAQVEIYVHVPSQQELDLLFGPLYDEFFNACSNPQDKQPTMNIQSTSAPSTPTYVHAEEDTDNQAEEGEQLHDDEFTNPLCTPAQKEAVPTFNQPQVSEYRWMKDHPLEQVCGNPSRPAQTK